MRFETFRSFLMAIALGLLPVAVFVVGGRAMSTVSGQQTVSDQKPLNRRFVGYDTKAVDRYWGALDTPAHRRAEQQFLELDLVFPVFYGTALILSLLTASALLGGPVRDAWLIVPVVSAVVADWTENLVQLEQLRNYLEAGETGLAPGWIHVASTATIVKLWLLSMSSLALLALLCALFLRARPAR